MTVYIQGQNEWDNISVATNSTNKFVVVKQNDDILVLDEYQVKMLANVLLGMVQSREEAYINEDH